MTPYKFIRCFSFFLFLLTTTVSAQDLLSPVPHATHTTTLDNINLGDTNKIFRSQSGYLWIGTSEGLIRFDGYSAKRYKNNSKDDTSLSHNAVFDILEDKQHNLWIATYGGGLNKFTPQTGQFETMDLRLKETDDQVLELHFLSIDKQNQLWIGSTSGLLRFDITSKKAVALPPALAQIPKASINGALIDSQNNLWIGSFAYGVYYYQRKANNAGKLHHFIHDETSSTSISNNNIRTITTDENGDIWLGTTQGLNKYNPTLKTFERFVPSNQKDINDSGFQDDIIAIQTDHNGHLWIGTIGGGTMMF
ncbi:MAG: hypothetical protein HRT35_15155 [Algicola sp.]|nr:hypothetical protein [Algicola sp.]